MGVVIDLIERALSRQKLASKSALARALGVLPNRLSEYAAGSRVCPLPRLMELARMAGRDPGRIVVAYMEERNRAKK